VVGSRNRTPWRTDLAVALAEAENAGYDATPEGDAVGALWHARLVDGRMKRQRALDAEIRDFGEAWAHGDTDTLREVLSPSYTHTDARGGDFWIAMRGWNTFAATAAERPHTYHARRCHYESYMGRSNGPLADSALCL
jgi:hypothetical protein